MGGKDSRLNVPCPVTCPCQRNAANDADLTEIKSTTVSLVPSPNSADTQIRVSPELISTT
ncbi:unnamed protein product [Brassica rapa subsp. narinosa]